MGPVVSVQGLVQRFADHTVLDEISISVSKGELLAVMGSSGGGKTTLLRCIAGLQVPNQGSVHVAGIDVIKQPEEARRRMGMVFQSAALFDSMTVEENVLFGLERTTKFAFSDRKRRAKEALGAVGLLEAMQKTPSELSGGMRKRVGLARAVALEPDVILYDEPTTGLDPITSFSIDELMLSIKDRTGVTSMVVSHDVASVKRVADRVAFLHQGRLVFVGTFEEFSIAEHPAIRELLLKAGFAPAEPVNS